MENKEANTQDQASILKAVAHPVRLEILKTLAKGPACVHKVNELFDVSQPNLSQHLASLKKAGLVDCRVDGTRRCYFLCRPTLVL
ncbi:MAG: metalloregulator ArsR/SmtB family transcription factor, partial [Planctomycetia bacterium]